MKKIPILLFVSTLMWGTACDPQFDTLTCNQGIIELVPHDNTSGSEVMYHSIYACGISFEELSPRMFSFNNPFGACPECTGIGYLMRMDEDLIIPDKNKTLYELTFEPL